MQIRVGYEIIYDCPQPTPMILTLQIHFTRVSDLIVPRMVKKLELAIIEDFLSFASNPMLLYERVPRMVKQLIQPCGTQRA